jgi:hypothetical protein
MKHHQIFRPKANLGWAAVAAIFIALFLAQAIAFPAEGSLLLVDLLAAALMSVFVYLFWIRPKLILKETSLTVINPLRTVEISYVDIEVLETKWALLLHHAGRKTRVWVAPANGRRRWVADSVQRWSVGKFLQQDNTATEMTSISQSVNSDSGLAYQLIIERINRSH